VVICHQCMGNQHQHPPPQIDGTCTRESDFVTTSTDICDVLPEIAETGAGMLPESLLGSSLPGTPSLAARVSRHSRYTVDCRKRVVSARERRDAA
jgi:hypothetical protein